MVFRAGEVVTAERLNDEIATAGGAATPILEVDEVAAFEGPAPSGVYGDLATPGPAVTLDLEAGQTVVVQLQARITCIATNNLEVSGYMSFAVSGANTLAADDGNAAVVRVNTTSATETIKLDNTQQRDTYFTAAAGGSTTFTAQYKDITGNGGNTFGRRKIIVKNL